ncbi:hypothetical protein B0H19DRAFT_1105876 [Mycena capillaripes]|nr:hypothetical protein B0H19DRAFT_1105876 [Mycena capillaripes]
MSSNSTPPCSASQLPLMAPSSPTNSLSQLHIRSSELEREITKLRAHLIADLVAERESVQSKLDSIIYPVLQLPCEITTEIFLWCIRSEHGFTSQTPITANLKSIPTQLASVCRDWQYIVLLTPYIWSFMTLCLNPTNRTDDLDRRFSLCGNCPLSLNLFYSFTPFHISHDLAFPLPVLLRSPSTTVVTGRPSKSTSWAGI